jgi:hypothetical protein
MYVESRSVSSGARINTVQCRFTYVSRPVVAQRCACACASLSAKMFLYVLLSFVVVGGLGASGQSSSGGGNGDRTQGSGSTSARRTVGRPKTDRWSHYTTVGEYNKKRKRHDFAKCNYCERVISSHPRNLQAHAVDCKGISEPQRLAFIDDCLITSTAKSPDDVNTDTNNVVSSGGRAQTLDMMGLVDQPINPRVQAELNTRLAVWVACAGVPFRALDHPMWKSAWELAKGKKFKPLSKYPISLQR